MDIDLLSKMVKELILDNDRVVLPGLGCFVAELVPATFSDKGYTINPPYRKLYFRSKPDTGSEIVDFYAESNSLDKDVACRILGDFIAELREIIYTRKVVIFPGLGRLRATKENNLFFIADEDLDIYPAGLGLESISLKTHSETPQQVSETVEELKAILEQEPAEEVAEETAEEVAVELAEKPAEETVEEVVEETVVELAGEPAEEVAEEAVPEVAEETVQETAEEVAVELAGEPAEEVVQEAVEEAAEETAEEPAPELVQEVRKQDVRVPENIVEKTNAQPLWKKILVAVGVILLAVVAAMLIYVAVARLCPEFIDKILYTPEELEILNK